MKIRLSELRQIIREVIDEEAWVPGRWYPGSGEPVHQDDLELMGTAGMGHHHDDEHDRYEDEMAAGLDEEDLDELDEAKKKKKSGSKDGLWKRIWDKRKRGEPPAKPGEEGYPKTLDI